MNQKPSGRGILERGRPSVPDGFLEVLKWLALFSMTYDHVVRFLFSSGGVGEATAFGRLAFPLFSFILAYNLSRPGTGPAVYHRVIGRLVVFGLLATPAYWYFLGPRTLNILFTFALAVCLVWCFERRGIWAGFLAVFLIFCSNFVEYGFLGMILILSFFACCRLPPGHFSFLMLAGGFTALMIVNGNWWGLSAIPLIMMAPYITVSLPRSKWLFYWFYPAHLSILVAIHYFWIR